MSINSTLIEEENTENNKNSQNVPRVQNSKSNYGLKKRNNFQADETATNGSGLKDLKRIKRAAFV